MAGYTFLPLGYKPTARTQQPAPQPKENIQSAPKNQSNNQDDEWYDCSSASEPATPRKSTMNRLSETEKAKLLPYMPSLFDQTLPPCGLEIQVAYERLVQLLRSRWFAARGLVSATDLCRDLKNELDAECTNHKPFSLRMTKRRKPWRRETVFDYELRWANYLLREVLEPSVVDRKELELERMMESPVPSELRLWATRPDTLELWVEWNKKKRELDMEIEEV